MSRLRPDTVFWPRRDGSERAPAGLRAVVVGGGIAGAAAATILVERGVSVTLLERAPALGGRAAAWSEQLDGGERYQMERGFHAFFRQYYNLRAWLRRIDPELSLLAAVSDYPILAQNGVMQTFKDLPTTPGLGVAALAWRTPYLSGRDLLGVNKRAALSMLAFDMEQTYLRFDSQNARDYLDSLAFPERARRMLFDVFAHSFFNAESEMSAAELLMMFHFYFTGNPEGLIFDVVRRPFSTAIWQPFERWLAQRGATLRTGTGARELRRESGRWRVLHDHGREDADLVVLALDVRGLKQLVQRSPALDDNAFRARVARLTVTRPFAVWRLWLDRPVRADRAPFAGTVGLGMLDNISVYEKLEDESARWARRHGGAVVELHGYALPKGVDEAAIKAELLAGLRHLYPETRVAKIVHDSFLIADDCPGFPPDSAAMRPTVDTPFAGLALCGDLVKLPVPAALMEKAATSGFLAANSVLAPFGVRAEPIRTVPRRGVFAPLRAGARLATPRPRESLPARRRSWSIGAPLPPAPRRDRRPDWAQASPLWIQRALAQSQSLPSGGWYVAGPSRGFGAQPRCARIAGRALVIWRDVDGIRAAPNACPHLGASLADGHVRDGRIICPWHGLALGAEGHGKWQPLTSHDDGVLFWVRLDDAGEQLSDRPFLCERPERYVEAVVQTVARCEPRDVIQNRLDPWHGIYLHAHTFVRLRVLDQRDDQIIVRVAYKLVGPLTVEVDARFHCPDPRTIVMTIVAGDGTGSVVETHATPIGPGRTAIIEATLATSERSAFKVARALPRLVRPFILRSVRRLWTDDAAYAERLYALRNPHAAS